MTFSALFQAVSFIIQVSYWVYSYQSYPFQLDSWKFRFMPHFSQTSILPFTDRLFIKNKFRTFRTPSIQNKLNLLSTTRSSISPTEEKKWIKPSQVALMIRESLVASSIHLRFTTIFCMIPTTAKMGEGETFPLRGEVITYIL